MENPFDNPTTIRNPEHFVGRSEQLERILGLIKNKQNVSLVGPKRIGKTSLLTCLKNETIQKKLHFDGSGFIFLYLDLQKRSMKPRIDFFDDVIHAFKEQSQGYIGETGLAKDDEFNMMLSEFQRRGLYPVLMIDTFDEIVRYEAIDVNVFDFLRAHGTSGEVTYVTASIEPLGKVFNKLLSTRPMGSEFYNIFTTVKLSPFLLKEARTLLTTFSERGKLPFDEQEIEWVLDIAGPHPFLLQQVAALLFQAKKAQVHSSEEINLMRIRKEALQNLQSYFDDCWKMLGDDDRQRLLREVQQRERQGRGDADYPELSSGRLFQDYLHLTGELEEASIIDVGEISQEDFKKILSQYGDPRMLGESPFIEIPSIAAQIKQQNAVSSISKGKIVQKMLKEALDDIGGQGQRSDEARDWVDYNILYYRYFMLRHDLSQDGIARRLLISPRQYYRLFPRAVERLWHALLAMEVGAKSSQGI